MTCQRDEYSGIIFPPSRMIALPTLYLYLSQTAQVISIRVQKKIWHFHLTSFSTFLVKPLQTFPEKWFNPFRVMTRFKSWWKTYSSYNTEHLIRVPMLGSQITSSWSIVCWRRCGSTSSRDILCVFMTTGYFYGFWSQNYCKYSMNIEKSL